MGMVIVLLITTNHKHSVTHPKPAHLSTVLVRCNYTCGPYTPIFELQPPWKTISLDRFLVTQPYQKGSKGNKKCELLTLTRPNNKH